jgi:hypothetical protein
LAQLRLKDEIGVKTEFVHQTSCAAQSPRSVAVASIRFSARCWQRVRYAFAFDRWLRHPLDQFMALPRHCVDDVVTHLLWLLAERLDARGIFPLSS